VANLGAQVIHTSSTLTPPLPELDLGEVNGLQALSFSEGSRRTANNDTSDASLLKEGARSAPTLAKRNSPTFLWMGTAFGVALGLAVWILAIKGVDTESLKMALRVTARWSFLPFWIAYSGGAMAVLFGPVFKPFAERGREFGLAYAAAQLIHLGLVVWLFQISSSPPLSGLLAVFFSVALFWTYLLALFSFGGLSKLLGSAGWRTLQVVGLNFIMLAFARDFVPTALHGTENYGGWRLVQYAPFAALCVVGPLLVLAATARRELGTAYPQNRRSGLPSTDGLTTA
jgi:hypothetical protein